jgi:hypothetical protein
MKKYHKCTGLKQNQFIILRAGEGAQVVEHLPSMRPRVQIPVKHTHTHNDYFIVLEMRSVKSEVKVLGEILFPCLFQLLEIACVSWVPSSTFKVYHPKLCH